MANYPRYKSKRTKRIYRKTTPKRKPRRVYSKRSKRVVRSGRALRGYSDSVIPRQYNATNLYNAGNAAFKMYKPASRTITLGDDDNMGTGVGNEWSSKRVNWKIGRITTRKIISNTIEGLIDRWQRLKAFNTNGSLFFSKQTNSPVSGATKCPIFLMDLSCIPNIVDDTGNINYPQNMWELYFINATGQYGWLQVPGQAATGSTGTTYATGGWQYEKVIGGGSVIKAPHANALLKWLDVRMNLWGTSTKPVKVTASIVQLPTYAQPIDTYNVAATAVSSTAGIVCSDNGTSGNDQGSVGFWTELLDHQTYNPISIVGRRQQKGLKVIRTTTVQFDPKTSIESGDTDPHCKTVKMFVKAGRKLNYAWQDSTYGLTGNDTTDAVADWDASIGNNNCFTHPNAKLYLMLRAHCYASGSDSNPTAADFPSFDLVVRRKIITNV